MFTQVLLFIIFLIISWMILMKIFSFSTYHKYFLKSVPILILYSILIFFLIKLLGFQDYFYWYLFLIFIFLFINNLKQRRLRTQIKLINSNNIDNNKKQKNIKLSLDKTIKYHSLSSIIFIAVLGVSFLLFVADINNFSQVSFYQKNNIDYFNESIKLKNKATETMNSNTEQTTLPLEKSIQWIEYLEQALYEAKKVNIQKLNSGYSGLGDHYKKEFIGGIELLLEGIENSSNKKLLQGQVLLHQWNEWYNKNIENIRKR